MTLFETGVRPVIDEYLAQKRAEVRDYGQYWSASSAGYCMRKNIFERLQVPHVSKEDDERKTRVFESGHVFHNWLQSVTKNAGISVAQELELQDDELMIRGHVDDLVLIDSKLMLYDYKTAHSRSFHYAKDRPMSYFHKMQVGTYMHMLRQIKDYENLSESRVMKISKDDLCMMEHQLMWSQELEEEVLSYWRTINEYWAEKKIPPCTCADKEGGFMANEKYNPYFYQGEPCSLAWYKKFKETPKDERNRDLAAQVDNEGSAGE